MKMKNKNFIYKHRFKFYNSAVTSAWTCCYVFCFMLIPLNLLASLTNTAHAKSDMETYKESVQSNFPPPQDPNGFTIRDLRLAEISSAKEKNDQKSKEQLRQMINQISSIELTSQRQSLDLLDVQKRTEKQEPNEIPFPMAETQEVNKSDDRKEEAVSQPSPGKINDITLQMLKNLSQHPDELHNPFELGEVLFLSGHPQEAVIFYQEALRRTDAKDVSLAQERAWILFQIGNCLRNNDMPAAGKIYEQLIAEYSNSPWTELAQAQAKLIEWLQKEKPDSLIVGNEP